jgi:hypothetical protein
MQDLSLHLLDLAQNSISAMASLVQIYIYEDWQRDWVNITIVDNGRGMDEETILRVTDPFYTTRTTRKVGLGLPLYKATAERCGGHLTIESSPERGTKIVAEFMLSHIDRPPFGKLDDTIITLILCNPQVEFVYSHKTHKGEFKIDTRNIREIIGDMPIEHPEIIGWIHSYIREGLNEIDGGVQ